LQRFTPSARRLLSFGGAVLTGIAVSAMLAAPASAHTADVTGTACKTTTGTWVVTWKVSNDHESKMHFENLDAQPSTIEGINDKTTIAGNGSVTGTQTLDQDGIGKASLSFKPTWEDGFVPKGKVKATPEKVGKCKPEQPQPKPSESSEAPPPPGGGGGGGSVPPTPSKPTLPVTGSQTAIYGGGAAVLLGAGAGLFFVARRRRIRFEA
jgi:LPXTG-motif cell wall-anchored protein